MWLTKKILVATDFAEPSLAAADVGVELAQTFHVPLVLMHAYLVPSYLYTGVPFVPLGDYVQGYEDAARESLEKERARLASNGVDVTAILRAGVAWEDILSTAQQVDAGLILVGTHGRRGVPHALLGSVAEKVVRLSPVPVLTIHGIDASNASVNVSGKDEGRRSKEGPAAAPSA
jgi:nucleotide-binding universal stress UspA family protein